MDAVISGRAGKAFLSEGDSFLSFDVDDPGTLVPMQPSDFHLLFADAPDIKVIENTNMEAVASALEFEHECACALDLTLIALDPELSAEVRTEAVDALEELLLKDGITERLERILYARPLPRSADLTGAIECCDTNHAPAVRSTLEALGYYQQAIREVRLAWDAIDQHFFTDDQQREYFQRLSIHEGLFRSLVMARGIQPRVNKFRVNSLLNPLIHGLRNSREVLQQWVAPFLLKGNVPSLTPEMKGEEREEPISETLRRRGRGGYDRARALENVESQKDLIIKAMQRRDLARVRQIVDELVEYNMQYGGPKLTVKSLCDLAMEAKTLGMSPLQLELTERSISIAPDDAWSWAQHGDALLNMQRLDEALNTYQQAEAFGEGVVAKNGRAEVLKAMGKLDAALIAYNEAVAAHPEDAAAKNGRAEVLKAMGELDAALIAYNENIAAHPEDVFAKNGRAEVLKARGDLSAALDAYNEVIAAHPENAVARRGRSCVLAALGRYTEALEFLPDKQPDRLDDWIGYHIRGMILLRTGKVSDAIRIFSEGVQNNPLPSSKEYFRRALSMAWIRGGDFKRASKELEEVKSPLLQPPANILRIHAFGAQGDVERATVAYDSLASKPQFFTSELTQELRRQFILKEAPRHDEEWIFDREVKLFLLAA